MQTQRRRTDGKWEPGTALAACLGLFVAAMLCASPALATSKVDFEAGKLPGLATQLDFKQYAGYLPVNKQFDDNLFFWLFESQDSPSTDPLVIWLSGGPGCSSIAAMFEENGPYKLHREGHEITLSDNPYSWNARANIIYLDQPVGTGMSYSGTNTFAANQWEVNEQFYEFLRQFYAVFPEYEGRPLFITGESYAGHMIPGIADYILKQEGRPGSVHVNLAGLAVGNGWIDPLVQRRVLPDQFYAAGLIEAWQRDEAKKLFAWAVANGGAPAVDGYAPPKKPGYTFPKIDPEKPYPGLTLPPELQDNPHAQELQKLLDGYKGKYLNSTLSVTDFIHVIDIIGAGPPQLRKLLPTELSVVFLDHSHAHMVFQFFLERLVSYTGHNRNYVNLMDVLQYGPVNLVGLPTEWPADDAIFAEYMNQQDVRRALNAESYPAAKTTPCNPMVSYVFNYINNEFQKSFLFIYPAVLNKIPVLFYNGQNDMICSAVATSEFLLEMAQDPNVYYFPGKAEYAKAPYVAWSVKDPDAGEQPWGNVKETRYGYYKHAGNLHFLNVLDASHMVPLSKPKAAQILLNDFIHHGRILSN